ncbi:MAG: TonB-dependent receptor [Bacteroidetes bacterium]|nr:TonB-dependent receptor [Bacteroidota bacterium]
MSKSLIIFVLLLASISAAAQNGVLKGIVLHGVTNEPIADANVVLSQTQQGVSTDSEGKFELNALNPGIYTIQVSHTTYETKHLYGIEITNAKLVFLEIRLSHKVFQLKDVDVSGTPKLKIPSAYYNLPTFSSIKLYSEELDRDPGSNRDIAKVIQTLPGVTSTLTFRNDIIVHGGAPGENAFYLDGIPIPAINHFAAEGASGGPVSLLNMDLIHSMEFYSGGFPSKTGNALSSIATFVQKEGNREKYEMKGTLGASDFGIVLQGPTSKKSSLIISARRSYLKALFKAIGLPYLPVYNDVQFKQKFRINKKNELIIIGLGGSDIIDLNLEQNSTPLQKYILGYIPEYDLKNYTIGAVYKQFRHRSYHKSAIRSLSLSKSFKDYREFKFKDNDKSLMSNLMYDYQARENSNNITFLYELDRQEVRGRDLTLKINYGASYDYISYSNVSLNQIIIGSQIDEANYNTDLYLNKLAFFGDISGRLSKGKIYALIGLRAEANDYSNSTKNILNQFSPRLALRWHTDKKFSPELQAGIYHQMPSYPVLAYRDSANNLVNQQNNLSYIRVKAIELGTRFWIKENYLGKIMGFYKEYHRYPFLLRDSIPLAMLGSEYGIFGNEPAISTGEGRTYGIEFQIRRRLIKGFYALANYTFLRSEFKDKNDKYVPSTWDNRHIAVITLRKQLKKHWEIGVKWRYIHGFPFTPYDTTRSAIKAIWDVTHRGIPDYDQLNTGFSQPFHKMDLRIDKRFYFNKWNLNFFIDLQNFYSYEMQLSPYFDIQRDENDNFITDPNNSSSYQSYLLDNTTGRLIPIIGLNIEL